MNEDTTNRLSESYKKVQLTEADPAQRKGLQAAAEIMAFIEEDKPRITEADFTNKYLPFFLARTKETLNLDYWIKQAAGGSPYKSVDVIGEGGEVLFTVPPIIRRGIEWDPTNVGNTSLRAVTTMALMKQNNLAGAGRQYFNENAEAGGLYKDIDVSADQQTWIDILARYGYREATPEEIAGNVSDVSAGAVVESPVSQVFSSTEFDEA